MNRKTRSRSIFGRSTIFSFSCSCSATTTTNSSHTSSFSLFLILSIPDRQHTVISEMSVRCANASVNNFTSFALSRSVKTRLLSDYTHSSFAQFVYVNSRCCRKQLPSFYTPAKHTQRIHERSITFRTKKCEIEREREGTKK